VFFLEQLIHRPIDCSQKMEFSVLPLRLEGIEEGQFTAILHVGSTPSPTLFGFYHCVESLQRELQQRMSSSTEEVTGRRSLHTPVVPHTTTYSKASLADGAELYLMPVFPLHVVALKIPSPNGATGDQEASTLGGSILESLMILLSTPVVDDSALETHVLDYTNSPCPLTLADFLRELDQPGDDPSNSRRRVLQDHIKTLLVDRKSQLLDAARHLLSSRSSRLGPQSVTTRELIKAFSPLPLYKSPMLASAAAVSSNPAHAVAVAPAATGSVTAVAAPEARDEVGSQNCTRFIVSGTLVWVSGQLVHIQGGMPKGVRDKAIVNAAFEGHLKGSCSGERLSVFVLETENSKRSRSLFRSQVLSSLGLQRTAASPPPRSAVQLSALLIVISAHSTTIATLVYRTDAPYLGIPLSSHLSSLRSALEGASAAERPPPRPLLQRINDSDVQVSGKPPKWLDSENFSVLAFAVKSLSTGQLMHMEAVNDQYRSTLLSLLDGYHQTASCAELLSLEIDGIPLTQWIVTDCFPSTHNRDSVALLALVQCSAKTGSSRVRQLPKSLFSFL
jgi:hypothetical protein